MDDNSNAELGIAVTEAKAAQRKLEHAKGFERSHNGTINQLDERVFGMFCDAGAGHTNQCLGIQCSTIDSICGNHCSRINFCVLQKHGNKTKEGSGCFATAASEGTFAEYIIGIYFVFHELANTLTALIGNRPRLKSLPKVTVFLNCFAVLLASLLAGDEEHSGDLLYWVVLWRWSTPFWRQLSRKPTLKTKSSEATYGQKLTLNHRAIVYKRYD